MVQGHTESFLYELQDMIFDYSYNVWFMFIVYLHVQIL